MEKPKIKNRNNQTLVLITEIQTPQKGLAFIAHGLGGFKEQTHLQAISEAFLESEYSVVRWDAANTIGESEGSMEEASITTYYEDLEDVINWSKKQPWYQEPFVLCGHSLGGIITALYAEKYPEKVKALAPISTVVSGKLSFDASKKKELEEWKKKGFRLEESKSKPGVIKKLKWAHMEDRLKYDLLEDVGKLTMPVLLMVGEMDKVTPLGHQKILYDAIPNDKKELNVIKSAPHTFKDQEHLEEIKKIFLNWIKSIN